MRCDSCGIHKDSAKPRIDPFQAAVWDNYVMRILCDYCFRRRTEQIAA